MVKSLFTSEQVEKLRHEYARIKAIDPTDGGTGEMIYEGMKRLLDEMPQVTLKQVADAKINFLSGLARNRLARLIG
jgi:hypothetical protein